MMISRRHVYDILIAACTLLLLALAFLAWEVQAQPMAPPGHTVRVDTIQGGAMVHKLYLASEDDYLQVWAGAQSNRTQHWHRRYPRSRECGVRAVRTRCSGLESLPYYRDPER